jgi:hypothetical protein
MVVGGLLRSASDCVLPTSSGIEGITCQPLNLKIEGLNATISEKEDDIRDISSILYNLGSF